MRNISLATAAVLLAAIATPTVPASAGGYGHYRGYDYGYDYYYVNPYRNPPPVGTVYKHYLPDEDDFGPVPRYYAPRYASRYHYKPHYRDYRDYKDYGHYSRDSDCDWLYRRAKRTDSRYWWRRYEKCED